MATFPTISRALLLSLGVHLLFLWSRPLPEAARSGALTAHLAVAPAVAKKAESAAHVAPAPIPKAPTPAAPAVPVSVPLPPSVMPSTEPVAAAPSMILPAASMGLDAAGLRSYRVALALAVRRSGVFESLSPNMRGRVELGLSLSAHGQLLGVEVLRSSGNSLLDHRAVLALSDAAPRTMLPNVLQGQAFRVVLPLEVE